MRGRLALATVALLPLPLLLFYGCGSGEPDIENLCGWLQDPANCLVKFHDDVGARGGRAGRGNAPKGAFLGRDKLDQCFLTEGGVVLFDPPLDPATFPLQQFGFKMVDDQGVDCGAGAITQPPYLFSITVNPYPPDAGGGSGTGGGGGSATGGGDTVAGGTFAVTSSDPARQTFDTACPPSETHHFDRISVTECRSYEKYLPQVEVESSAGTITNNGFVRVRVYYPPTGGVVDPGDGGANGQQPEVVEYFDCTFPGPPEPCADSAKDGDETDIDCGGSCPAKCLGGQKCREAVDCLSGECILVNGLKQCTDPPATSSSSGGGGGAGGTGGAGGAGGAGGGGGAGGN